jgi:hypothetical protein
MEVVIWKIIRILVRQKICLKRTSDLYEYGSLDLFWNSIFDELNYVCWYLCDWLLNFCRQMILSIAKLLIFDRVLAAPVCFETSVINFVMSLVSSIQWLFGQSPMFQFSACDNLFCESITVFLLCLQCAIHLVLGLRLGNPRQGTCPALRNV